MKYSYRENKARSGKIIFVFIFLFFGMDAVFSMDRQKISQWYFDGEFEKVRDSLEACRKTGEKMKREDSIFIYKHLSVVYAAKPDTREKAESYMYQLLKLVPTVDLIDMYISDNIESIFNTVKERYYRLNKTTEVNESPKRREKKKKPWIWWTAAGTGVAALVAVFVISGDDKGEPAAKTHELDL